MGQDGGTRDPSLLEDAASITEETPLIRSGASSPRPLSNGTSPSSETYRDVEGDDHEPDEPNQRVGLGRAFAIVFSVYLLIFLQADELDAYEDASWFTSSFLIAMSSCAPLAGRLASIFSPRIIVLGSSLLFAIGNLVTSQAHSFPVFILGRVITGTGGSAILVLAFILILELTTKRRRGLFIGMVNAGFTTGISLGAVVFGALISSTGWRALFYVQVPLSVVAGLGVYLSIPKSFKSGQSTGADDDYSLAEKLKRIDYLGAILLTATIVLFLYGLSASTISPLPILLSLVSLLLFLQTEYRLAADPIVPLAVLGSRGALLSCAAQLGLMAARWTVLFYAPIYALAVWGLAPAAAGSVLVPTNLGFGLGGLAVGWLHVRRAGSFWAACLASVALFAGSLLVLGVVSSPGVFPPPHVEGDERVGVVGMVGMAMGDGEYAWPTHMTVLYVFVLFANGLCTGAALNYTLAHVLHLTPPHTHYMATSLIGTFRGFAGSFGSAIGGGIFARTLRASLEEGFKAVDGNGDGNGEEEEEEERRHALIRRLLGSPALVHGGDLTSKERQVAVEGYANATSVLFLSAVALSVVVLFVQAGTGWKRPVEDHEAERPAAAGNPEVDSEDTLSENGSDRR
ncbi:putative mfs multidrug transporter protein [Eutypa lata UCREL1]|uniref:Putative mfs multidrug transporter protein n=1 Tax=Eutypa lata (strain UCR-EL1) TaxID=1287681 RepID=M7TQC4_EUTLA|nr:putative mfs multidrug transporter protein [Eutypa lata UCREL1]